MNIKTIELLLKYLQIDYLHPKIHEIITAEIKRNLK